MPILAGLRRHRRAKSLAASALAASAFALSAWTESPARAAEHTLMPTPQTVHIGHFLACPINGSPAELFLLRHNVFSVHVDLL